MQTELIIPIVVGVALGVIALASGAFAARRLLRSARETRDRLLEETRSDAENRRREILVAAKEKGLALNEELERQERDLEQRESEIDDRRRAVEEQRADLGRQTKQIQRQRDQAQSLEKKAIQTAEQAEADHQKVRATLEQAAAMTQEQAREALIADIEEAALAQAARLARKIEDDARETAEQAATQLIVQAAQRVDIAEAAESTVSFIELPSDEMKGRIIGKEGRNIRALEMATGIDLVVDDTPRTILVSSFDPLRREIARVSIQRLVEDGRIHPARIEEVVAKVRTEIDEIIDQKGSEVAFGLGISDMHPRLARLVGLMRYHNGTGQNLLQHSLETAMIAGHMASQIGARVDVAQRAGLLHEIGRVDGNRTGQPLITAADLCAKYDESSKVIHAIRAMHPNEPPRTLEAILVATANRLSDARPGARKENLAVFIERLRRLEQIATSFAGVSGAFAVKSGKEIRVIADVAQTSDRDLSKLSKLIARAVEKELNYPGQIKINVVRENRAVRFAV